MAGTWFWSCVKRLPLRNPYCACIILVTLVIYILLSRLTAEYTSSIFNLNIGLVNKPSVYFFSEITARRETTDSSLHPSDYAQIKSSTVGMQDSVHDKGYTTATTLSFVHSYFFTKQIPPSPTVIGSLVSPTPESTPLVEQNPRWRSLDHFNMDTYVYSAHFDDVDAVPFLRVILAIPGEKLSNFTVMCVYTEGGNLWTVNGIIQGYRTGHSSITKLKAAFIICPLAQPNHRPTAVSVCSMCNKPEVQLGKIGHPPVYANNMAVHYSGQLSDASENINTLNFTSAPKEITDGVKYTPNFTTHLQDIVSGVKNTLNVTTTPRVITSEVKNILNVTTNPKDVTSEVKNILNVTTNPKDVTSEVKNILNVTTNPKDVTSEVKNILNVTTNPKDVTSEVTSALNVTTNPTESKPGHRWLLTRCYPAIYNYNNVMELILQIEFSRLFGVQHFVFYLSSASPKVRTVLQHYEQQGVAEVFNWTFPKERVFYDLNDQINAIQDCLYRNLRASRFVLFGDLDEMFTPRSEDNLVPILSHYFSQNATCAAFLFRQVVFNTMYMSNVTDFPEYEYSKKHDLTMLLVADRLKNIWVVPERSKPAVNPLRVNVTDVHDVKGFRGNYSQCPMPPESALLHHYRHGLVSEMGRIGGGYVFDPHLRNYAKLIVDRVKKVLDVFKDLNSTNIV